MSETKYRKEISLRPTPFTRPNGHIPKFVYVCLIRPINHRRFPRVEQLVGPLEVGICPHIKCPRFP